LLEKWYQIKWVWIISIICAVCPSVLRCEHDTDDRAWILESGHWDQIPTSFASLGNLLNISEVPFFSCVRGKVCLPCSSVAKISWNHLHKIKIMKCI
jgi:hypothetical protein